MGKDRNSEQTSQEETLEEVFRSWMTWQRSWRIKKHHWKIPLIYINKVWNF